MRAHKFVGWMIGAAAGLAAVWTLGAQQPKQVDDAALKDAGKSGEEWIEYNGSWAEQRYSPLNQINDSNVSRLGLSWFYDIPSAPGAGAGDTRQEGTPLVYNGVLYSITPWSVVYAVDLHTQKEVWHSDPEVNQQVWRSRICCGVVNRGIAMYQGKIIAPVVDGRLRALDIATGRIAWETRVSPPNMAYTITMAPRVIKGGKVIVGVSGGEYGVRGFFDAYDAETGKQAWRFYTVPGDPSKPFEQPWLADWAKTWEGEWWKIGGGGPVWGGVAYDPDSDIVYVGTGQPGPWTDVYRGKGDNLCTDCIIAVRGSTGKLVWYYQTTPGDDWDFDSIADIMLADLPINGKTRHVLMHAPKNGFFYVLDRLTGELLAADPWVTVNWASGVNLKTGRPTVNPEARYGTDTVQVMPGPGGGHVWPPWSFNPTTGLVYVPSTTGQPYGFNATPGFTPNPTDIGPTGRGQMNMGTGAARGPAPAPAAGGAARGGAGGGAAGGGLAPGLDPNTVAAGRGGNAGGGAARGGAPAAPAVPSRLLVYALDGTASLPAPPPPPEAPAAAGAQAGGAGGAGRGGVAGGAARGGAGGAGRGGAARGPAPTPLPTIGPEGRGTPLIAWDPIAQKERWRADDGGAGYNQGGTLSTAGNLVFAGVRGFLRVYRADTGQKLLDVDTHLTQVGPPMTFLLDGKQYVAIAGSPAGGGGGFGGGGGAGRGAAGAAAGRGPAN